MTFREGPRADGAWAGRRLLSVDGNPAFELSHWCGTCHFLFQQVDGAPAGGSFPDLSARLAHGLEDLDEEVIERFGSLLPEDEYIPLLLQVRPRLVRPATPGDYFAEEQVDTWGPDASWWSPEHPRAPYYRTFETPVDAQAHLFEFIVPMVPPSWNDPERVDDFVDRLATNDAPTAVAVSLLDVCRPVAEEGSDHYAHWGLAHFLLDGHHKVEAAASSDRPLRLLSLLSVGAGLARPEQVARIPQLRGQQARGRGTR